MLMNEESFPKAKTKWNYKSLDIYTDFVRPYKGLLRSNVFLNTMYVYVSKEAAL